MISKENHKNLIIGGGFYYCVVCGGWEPWERFTHYDNLKLYKCDDHCGCNEYDHLYQAVF